MLHLSQVRLATPARTPESSTTTGFVPDIASPRISAWTDPAVASVQPYLATVVEAYEVGRPFTPGLPQWLELFIGLAEGLSSALSDQRSAKDALDDTAKKWETSIKQAPPDWKYAE